MSLNLGLSMIIYERSITLKLFFYVIGVHSCVRVSHADRSAEAKFGDTVAPESPVRHSAPRQSVAEATGRPPVSVDKPII